MAIVQCGAVVWADVNRERGGASGGSAMRLDAAVMGTCPTFINQSRRRREGRGEGRREEGREGRREGEREVKKGNSVRGDGRRERMPGEQEEEEGEEESFSGRGRCSGGWEGEQGSY